LKSVVWLFDTSPGEDHFAVATEDHSLAVFERSGGSAVPKFLSSYCPSGYTKPPQYLDACFFTFGDLERLVVLVGGENRLHLVDYSDGCKFVGCLDTGSVQLEYPKRLATDCVCVLWIACSKGKVVVLTVDQSG
jgi:hypothetical protein